METKKFINDMINVFEEADPVAITAEAKFRDIEGYSSFTALSIIAMVDEEYHVKIKGDDIRQATTIGDLFNIIKSKKQ